MATVEELRLQIKAEVSDAVSKLKQYERQTKETTQQNKTLSQSFAAMRDIMQGPVAAAKMVGSGLRSLAATSKQFTDAWEKQEQAVAKLEGVMRATGGTVGLTSEQLQEFAAEIQSSTTYGDEAILDMMGTLATFKSVSGDTFKSATKLAVDMSAAFGGDLKSSSMQLGKALEDPIRGVTALQRIGVSFTISQKQMIEELVNAGDKAGAQALILSELETQVGGVADAMANTGSGALKQYQNTLSDTQEQMGRFITEGVRPMITGLNDFIGKLGEAMKAHNDFNDAFAAKTAGTATQRQELVLLEAQLANLIRLQKTPTLAKPDAQYKREVTALENKINALRAAVEADKKAGEAAATRAAVAAVAAKAEEEAAEAQVALTKKREAIITTYKQALAELDRQVQAGMMTDKEASKKKQDALKSQIDGLTRLINEENLTRGATIALRDELTKAYVSGMRFAEQVDLIFDGNLMGTELGFGLTVISKEASAAADAVEELTEAQKAMQSATIDGAMQMSEAFGAALVLGEDGWKAFGKAGLNAIAAVIQALAAESIAMGIKNLAGVVTAWAAPAYFAAGAALYASAGAVKAIPLAEGGIVMPTPGGTLARIGEAGKPEAVIPLDKMGNMGGMGGVTQIFNITGSVIAEREVKQLAFAGMAQASRGY